MDHQRRHLPQRRDRKNPSLRARDWNERIVTPAAQGVALPGAYSSIIGTQKGQVINFDPALGWIHPWFVSGGWKTDGFYFRVRPGFVNGEAPEVVAETDEAPAVTLLEAPENRINGWRVVDGLTDRIPGFFAQLGVRQPVDNISISESGGVQVDVTQRDETSTPPRLLMAADIWVSIARATYAADIRITADVATTAEVVDYNVRYDTATLDRIGSAPRLRWGPQFIPVRQPTLAERFMGQFTDDGEDRILISTIYMLSPPDFVDYAPSPQWQFFRSNNCFWNLNHAARNETPRVNPAPIKIFTGLLGGLGDSIGNMLLAGANEFTDRVRNAVNTTTNEGRFWTT
jgi:hypothetical protein